MKCLHTAAVVLLLALACQLLSVAGNRLRAHTPAQAPAPAQQTAVAKPTSPSADNCDREPKGFQGYTYPLYDHSSDCDTSRNKPCEHCELWLEAVNHPGSGCYASGTQNTPNHIKYVPYVPVRGVEDWPKAGDKLWDCAWNTPFAERAPIALGANAVTRRSEHQMHIHLAVLNSNVATALALAAKAGTIKKDSFSPLTIKGIGNGDFTVTYRDATNTATPFASDVRPFQYVYGTTKHDANNTGILVTERNSKSFYLITVQGTTVDCLLYRPDKNEKFGACT